MSFPSLYYFFTGFRCSFTVAAGENFTDALEGMLISLPVRGFRPVLAFFCTQEKLPIPGRTTLSPFARPVLMASVRADKLFSAYVFLISPAVAIASIRSALFIAHPSFCGLSYIVGAKPEDATRPVLGARIALP
jgi:hypothetical protein